jgi:hypothetical protein
MLHCNKSQSVEVTENDCMYSRIFSERQSHRFASGQHPIHTRRSNEETAAVRCQ